MVKISLKCFHAAQYLFRACLIKYIIIYLKHGTIVDKCI